MPLVFAGLSGRANSLSETIASKDEIAISAVVMRNRPASANAIAIPCTITASASTRLLGGGVPRKVGSHLAPKPHTASSPTWNRRRRSKGRMRPCRERVEAWQATESACAVPFKDATMRTAWPALWLCFDRNRAREEDVVFQVYVLMQIGFETPQCIVKRAVANAGVLRHCVVVGDGTQ